MEAPIVTEKYQPEEKKSSSWFWTWMLMLMLVLVIVAVYFFGYRRKKFHTNFNISMYFRNNELFNEFANSQPKSPSPRSIYPRVPPTIVEKMGKNFEVINNDSSSKNVYENISQMHPLSDDEFMTDVEFNDQNQRLIN